MPVIGHPNCLYSCGECYVIPLFICGSCCCVLTHASHMLLWPTRRLIHLFAEEEQLLLWGKHIDEFCHHFIEPLQHLCAGVGYLAQASILEVDAVDGIVLLICERELSLQHLRLLHRFFFGRTYRPTMLLLRQGGETQEKDGDNE